jgi:hypothetical protein
MKVEVLAFRRHVDNPTTTRISGPIPRGRGIRSRNAADAPIIIHGV